MSVINQNEMTIAGTHGLSKVPKTKIVCRTGSFEFPEPYVIKMRCYLAFFITNGTDDWAINNILPIEGCERNKKVVDILYDGRTDGNLFLFVDNKVKAHVLNVMPNLDPDLLVSEFEPQP